MSSVDGSAVGSPVGSSDGVSVWAGSLGLGLTSATEAPGLGLAGGSANSPAIARPPSRQGDDRDRDEGGGQPCGSDSLQRRDPCRGQRGESSGHDDGREVEQAAVLVAEEEDRGRPFGLVDLGEDGFARLGDGDVDRLLARDERRVQFLGEGDRRVVRDLELHRHDGRDPKRHDRRGDAGERVAHARSSALARVEDDEPKRTLVAEQVDQLRVGDGRLRSVLVLEIDHAAAAVGGLAVLDVAAVPDEVEDVVVALLEREAERLGGRRFQPVDGDGATLLRLLERRVDALALGRHVELREVVRAGDDAEDPDVLLDPAGSDRGIGAEEADDRRLALAGQEGRLEVEEFPGDAQQPGRIAE